MDFMETLNCEENHAALLIRLSSAYVECGELLKAKALNEKLLSMSTNVWTLFLSGWMSRECVTIKLQSSISEMQL